MNKRRHRAIAKARWETEVHNNKMIWTTLFESMEGEK